MIVNCIPQCSLDSNQTYSELSRFYQFVFIVYDHFCPYLQ